MKRVSSCLLYFVLSLMVIGLGLSRKGVHGQAAYTDWYIRPDGGTRFDADVPAGQCDGKHDASYASALAAAGGATSNLPCAFSDLRYIEFDGVYTVVPKPIIQGGDIVHIAAGQYRVGYNGQNPGDHDGLDIAGNPFATALPSIPGGTAAHPTTFIGAGETLTQVYAGYGAGAVFGINAPYITIQDMELTDHSQCSRTGTVGPMCSTNYGTLDDYAGEAISTGTGASNIVLKNLNIHGFVSRGIIGPIGGLVTVNNVRIGFNGGGGWDFDDGKGTQSINNAEVDAEGLTIEWNGFNEEYPIVHAIPALNGSDQNDAGYGDGVGTPGTPLNFTCNHCLFRYNTQDGLDLLHVSGGIIKVTNSQSYGNMGQQWKLGAMKSVLFQNNRTVHNCRRLSQPMAGASSNYNLDLSLFCRAAGDGIAINVMDGGTITFQNNSYAGYGATSYDIACGTYNATTNTGQCLTPTFVFQNNLMIGYKDVTNDNQAAAVFYWDSSTGMMVNPVLTNTNNVFYNMRTQPAGGTYGDPHIANEPIQTDGEDPATFEASLDSIDFHPTSASTNLLGQGVDVGITTDADGNTRPIPPSIGAFDTTATSGGTTTPPPITTPPTTVTILSLDWVSLAHDGDTIVTPANAVYRYGHAGAWTPPLTIPAATTFTVTSSYFGGSIPTAPTNLLQVQILTSPQAPVTVTFKCTASAKTDKSGLTLGCSQQ